MKMIVISSSDNLENETKLITQLFEHGMENFHLRKPKFSTRQLQGYIEEIPHQFHRNIIIHSHHRLALKFNLKGIHITKTHQRKKYKTWLATKYIKFKKPDILITRSFTKIASLFEEQPEFDYVFLSPVFDSASSKYQSGFTEHSLKFALEKTQFKVVARGGVHIHNIAKAKEIGFYGAALYSTLWKSPEPLKEFIRIFEKYKELEKNA
jgi:thiamine-phosphate pyrophosphorylase